ncbi:TonB-dependent receptor [Sphingomonas sp. 2R-10]|uniref:TonB-dependent receptor n=1 Tax=Sphingomonas sp. 2R-10 TaxID=3045148 RepID=UPI000F7909F7|nr:TonB-dependent receptor [Sphingomonas sp. 2R-10]MDJ0278040.1 TonB-dependent receptor [Sphingomonas sp. 2R-10]
MEFISTGRLRLLGTAAAILVAALPAAVQAQATAQEPATSPTDRPPSPVTGTDPVADAAIAQAEGARGEGEIVVTGIRQSYANALQAKRRAVGVTDGISSDGIGRFPDLNVGEALQRVPGVQINREAESRDATINVRGLPGTYARTTINGNSFADPVLDGSSPLGAFESDIFSAFVVVKSPGAAELPGGISGNVDLQIQRALARADGALSVKAMAGYEALTQAVVPSFTGSYSKHFLNDTLGVYAVGAWSKQNFRRDSISFNQYTPLSRTTTPNYAARYGATGNVLFPSDVRQFVKTNKGDRLSLAGGLEYAATPELTLSLNSIYTRRDYKQANTDLNEYDMRDGNTVVNPTGDVFTLADGNRYINAYDFSNARVFGSYRSEPSQVRAFGLYGDIGWKNDDWRLLTTFSYSDASNSVLQTQFDFRRLPRAGGNGTSGSIASGGADIADYRATIAPSPAIVFTPGPFAVLDANQLRNATGDVLIVAGSEAVARNDLYAGQSDVERFFGTGFLRSIQAGVRAERTGFSSQQFRSTVFGVQSQNLTSAIIVQSPFADRFFGNKVDGYNSNWQTVDFNLLRSQLQPVTLQPGQTLTGNGFVNNTADGGVGQLNFDITNDIASAYAMGKLEGEVAGINVRGNVGLRYEHTRSSILSTQYLRGVPSSRRDDNDYGEWLPSALVAADLTDRLILRGAYYRSFVRPQPRQVSPATVISGSGTLFNVTLGNTDLEPFTADSFDVSLEFYNRPGGNISLAAFTKRIDGLIAPETDRTRLCPSDGGGFGLGPLQLVGDTCQSTTLVSAGQPVQVVVNGNINSANPITVRGVEFSIQQNLDFLPAPWNGLGGGINYAYTEVSGRTASGSAAILPGVSKHTGNLIGYYETPLFGLRLTYNYRSKYDLAAGGTFAGAARQVRERGQLDASASLNLNARLSLTVDAFNITNAERIEYENDPLKPRRADFDGRTFQFGVRALF